jgi:hypothetical protein
MSTLLRLRWTDAALFVLGAGLFSGGFSAPAQADPRPAVVELFTSEGCNSCPPAEAYVGELAKRNDVLALAFHVDYWDDLGWRDRFGLSQSVERQRRYARALHLPSVYTPEVVVDGRDDYVGSNRNAIGQALRQARDGVPVNLSITGANVLVSLPAPSASRSGDVVLIAYRRKAVSPIGRGENAGRTLEEYNIVRAVRELGRWSGAAQDFRFPLGSLPQDATDIAVLVQAPGQGAVVGAATHVISP